MKHLAILTVLAGLMHVAGVRGADATTGTLKGVVDKPAAVKSIIAINRADDKKFTGKLDASSGKWTIEGLPLEAKFDLILEVGGPEHLLEGVNLVVPRSDYEQELPMTKDDVAKIRETVQELNQFEDKVEVMCVTGNIQHAAVVIHKQRTKSFINSNDGEVISRLEIWTFEKPDETWIKSQDDLWLVLHRYRVPKAEFEKKSITLDPSLGGLALTKAEPTRDVGTVEIPDTKPGFRIRAEKIRQPSLEKVKK